MRQKKFLFSALMAMILLFYTAQAFASYDYTTRWHYDGAPVNNIWMLNYGCLDSGCYTFGALLENTTSGVSNTITTHYPVPAPPYGYATYWAAPCLRAEEMAWRPTSDGAYTKDKDFTKYHDCLANINTVTSPASVKKGDAVFISANVQSAISEAPLAPWGEPDDPDFVRDYLSAYTEVTLRINDSSGSVVFTETRYIYVVRDKSQDINFSQWTVPYNDNYTIRITTTVPDCKCFNRLPDIETRILTFNDLVPTADAGGPYQCIIGDMITLNGSATGGNPPYTYAWDLDTGGQYDDSTAKKPAFNCSTPGINIVSLLVTDEDGDNDTDDAYVNVTIPGECIHDSDCDDGLYCKIGRASCRERV